MATRHFGRAALVAALLAGAASCAPIFDRPKPVEIRPVETPSADGAAAALDDSSYHAAAKAIEDRDYALALDFLQASRERQPHDVRVLNAFGVVYDKLGRFDLSARYYARARAIEPNSAIVLANIAYSRTLQGLTKDMPPLRALADATPSLSEAPAHSAQEMPARDGAAAKEVAVVDAPARVLPQTHADAAELRVLPDNNASASGTDAPAEPNWRAAANSIQTRPPGPSAAPAPQPQDFSRAGRSMQAIAAEPRVVVAQAAVQIPLSPASPAPGLPAAASPRAVSSARPAIKAPLLTGHPVVIVNASGRKGATESVRRRLVHLGWTAPRWAARESAGRGHTILLYARPYLPAARALAHSLKFAVRLSVRPCNCGRLELIVGEDFLRRFALAGEIAPGGDASSPADQSMNPIRPKEPHHVPA
ncbi:MAG TPA: LytR C-terminal domain-containing protein [Rhizomicrobium sp.]|jgi:hypothetical protein